MPDRQVDARTQQLAVDVGALHGPAVELGDEAVELLEKNIEAQEGDIESHALLGGVWEMQITSA